MNNNFVESVAKYGLAGIAAGLILLSGYQNKLNFDLVTNHLHDFTESISVLVTAVNSNTSTMNNLIKAIEADK